ncbi:hypothetical protein LTR70_002247 [Exophiala xenobiotica]|uniref:DUF7514 domain-containing protein n=1 Tax=Lithohypha guttulata TaxID=1690604 RepID=A0ABR0KLA7_9EURO|nr:hypothetical protein LTR24_001332 [Lithohypha guttulata]KAK5325982.1 hypothetical protein LTR70_002247 [Exophiala xenobiotica]
MSNHENRSSSPTDDLDGRQDKFQQTRQDPRTSIDGFGSPALKTARTGYQPYPSSTVNEGTQGTAASLSNQSSRQPISDAVTSAVNTTDSNLSPELIQLITQNVIQQLHVHKPTAAPSAQPVQPPSNILGDAPGTRSSFHESPILGRSSVYTPPSPHRSDDKFADNVTMPTMPTAGSVNASGYATRRRDVSPFSHASNEEAMLSEAESRTSRPEAPRRLSTDQEGTVLEKYWGKLFDVEGQSTQRLQHFLQGLALQLIENYEPKHSLVITPDKMQRFYEDTKLEERPEIYPWKLVFDDKTSSISRLLRERDIKVQHHLVQATPDARPDIPGLTPLGFASWMTLMIKAHPDHEYERLAKALRIMGVNHPQDRATSDETIAARLTELMAAHCKVQISNPRNSTTAPPDTEVPESPRKGEIPPAPTVEDVLDESEKAQTLRGRQPKDSGFSFAATVSTTSKPRDMPFDDSEPSKATSVTSIEDESDVPTRQPPLERQRQPYVAQPGGGKTYDLTSSGDETVEQARTQMPFMNDLRRTKSVSHPQRPRVPPPIAIHQRPEPQVPQPDGAEISRSRSNFVGGQTGASTHRSRSNSTHGTHEREARPHRRQRSNSSYANDAGKRYHPQRTPSFSKGGPDFQSPRATDPTLNYASYATNNRPASMYQPPTADRYEYTRPSAYDPRDPRYEREKSRDRTHDTRSRPRFQSSAGQDYPSPDDFRRSQQAYANGNGVVQPAGGAYQQYPPTAFRDGVR